MSLRWLLVVLAGAAPTLSAQQGRDLPITTWLVSAPLPSDTAAAGLDAPALKPEADLFAIPGRPTARTATADGAGRVDLLAIFRQPALDRRVVYAATFLVAPTERAVDLGVESDDDISVWLNGVLVHRHVVTRSVRMETDTVTLRLARGSNRLVYKIINRDGGFGFGGRLLASSESSLAGIVVSTRAGPPAVMPDPAVTIGPIDIPERAVLAGEGHDTRLVVELATRLTRWGAPAPAVLAAESVRVPVAASAPGRAVAVRFPIPWETLARRARGVTLRTETGGGVSLARESPPLADALLDQLSRPIALDAWHTDSSALTLNADISVPPVLGGLPLVLETAEFSRAPITVNGTQRSVGPDGVLSLCSPCAAGTELRLQIDIRGVTWWTPPALRVASSGWREIREGARWSRRLDPVHGVAAPQSGVRDSLLLAAADPTKEHYRAIIGRWLARLAPAAAHIRRDTIDVVGNSHLDVVWLWPLAEGVDVLRNTWRTATKLLARYPRMHFAASSSEYYALLEHDDPALLRSIQELVRQGRWDLVGGWWVEADANLPSGESLVRQGLYGQRTLRRLFGQQASVAWTPDTFGYPWSLPQILRGSGLDGFVTQKLRWNDRNAWPASLDAFWWIGPDGSRVLTYVPYGYDHDLDPDRLAAELDSTVAGGRMQHLLTLYGVGDHGGGPTMEMLERARDLARVPTFPVLRDAAPDSALGRMRAALPDGPSVRDELYLEYHRGAYTTNGAMKWWNRRLESHLAGAEAAATLAPVSYPREALTRAWEMTLFNQMHDLLPGTSIRAVHAQAEADYAAADSIALVTLDRSIRARLGRSDTRPPDPAWRSYGIFNASSASRAGRVRIPLAGTRPAAAYDAARRPLPSARRPDTLDVEVPEVSGFGTQLVFVAPVSTATTARPSGGFVLENERLRVRIDSVSGEIADIEDKVARRQVLRPGGNALVMLEDRPGRWDAWNINHLNGRRTRIDTRVVVGRAEHGLDEALTVTRERDSVRVVQRYVLPARAGRLDVETTVDWHTRHELLKAVFVLPFHADSVVAEIPYGAIARPTVPRTSVDSARFEVPMQRWIDASTGGYGVAIVNDSKYGYDARGDTVRLSLLRAPEVPDAISDQRTHHFTYSIVPHAGDWRAPEVRQAAEALNNPLVPVLLDVHPGGALPAPPLAVDGPGVSVGALKQSEDGASRVVRLVETRGAEDSVTLRFERPSVVREANLLEDPVGPASPAATSLSLRLKPWEIRTLLVEAR